MHIRGTLTSSDLENDVDFTTFQNTPRQRSRTSCGALSTCRKIPGTSLSCKNVLKREHIPKAHSSQRTALLADNISAAEKPPSPLAPSPGCTIRARAVRTQESLMMTFDWVIRVSVCLECIPVNRWNVMQLTNKGSRYFRHGCMHRHQRFSGRHARADAKLDYDACLFRHSSQWFIDYYFHLNAVDVQNFRKQR